MKSVIIVGAGVAGLTAAVYASLRGYNPIVLEQGITAGGVSTSWRRKGYYFEGGLHWLVGAGSAIAHLHQYWKEVGALTEQTPVTFHDPVFELRVGDQVSLPYWRNRDQLCQSLMDYAPEDRRRIKRFCRDMEICEHFFATPVTAEQKAAKRRDLPAFLLRMAVLATQSAGQYSARFKNPHLRDLLCSIVSARHNAISMMYTAACYSMRASGYPEGGSVALVQNIVEKLKQLGTEVQYRSSVTRICIEHNRATGVICNGQFVPADEVIVASDTVRAIDELFEHPFNERWARQMRRRTKSEACMYVSLGVKADLSHYAHVLKTRLTVPLPGRLPDELARVTIYSPQEGDHFAPQGCTAITIILSGDTYDYWREQKAQGTYEQMKQRVVQSVIDSLQRTIPEIQGCVEVTDMATPLTYERYSGNHHGGWMTEWHAWTLPPMVPATCHSVKNLHFAGHRTLLSGGLPIAITTGRRVAMALKA